MKNKKILVLAYAISPTRGSEYSVAWNYVVEMSKDNKLTVLYGASGDYMGDCEEMENYVNQHPNSQITFIPVYPNKLANLLNWPNRHHLLVYSFYYAYNVWQKLAYRKAKELVADGAFDLIHYVGMIGYREPGYLWNLGLPYIWGPICGANNSSVVLMKNMPLLGKLKHRFRTIANIFQLHYSRRLKKALNATDILLTATSENQRLFKNIHGKDSICIPENCIIGHIHLNKGKFVNPCKYNLVVIGSLDARKSVGILLEAVARLKFKEMVHVDIVGDGSLKDKLQQYAIKNGLNSLITWHGKLPRDKAVQVFDSAHLHVITSISEGNPTTIWEAMSFGVPTLSFDHCGMHDTLCDGAGILVPIESTYEANVQGITNAIDVVLAAPERLERLAEATLIRAKKYTWEIRRKFWNELYDELVMKLDKNRK
ncbi:glycosyltransferase family 4 protein [Bacteroides ovatus]|uniref:glycosyltransferase family 4 protein n=1 Tax=Bacteroides ovatus TaxID=28116 RepID=UPI001F307606|nr:glycosyltransferase [Bacteroides ovatus]MCE8924124.1 glycosyltransferase [Bacteroides ovatus]